MMMVMVLMVNVNDNDAINDADYIGNVFYFSFKFITEKSINNNDFISTGGQDDPYDVVGFIYNGNMEEIY